MMTSPIAIGIDTSCYTTSVAAADTSGIVFEQKTMLFVPSGNRGLRQSDGLFQHVRNLPGLMEHLFASVDRDRVRCVSVSAKPTDATDSYMPVFLAGLNTARAVAAALGVPIFTTTHQRGHIRAAEIGQENLIGEAILPAFHLSGGTTDLLIVRQSEQQITSVDRAGSSTDLHVGQFVDRVGVALGLPFPAGKHLEKLASAAEDRSIRIPASVDGLNCSFSGAETKAQQLIASGMCKETIAYAVYDCIARTLQKLIQNFRLAYGELPILLGGGVASSLLLRNLLMENRGVTNVFFSNPAYAADNAAGVALIGRELIHA